MEEKNEKNFQELVKKIALITEKAAGNSKRNS